jgi:ribonuclease HI
MSPDLTLFADASVDPKTKKSGWGFWMKGDDRSAIYAGGPLKIFTPNTSIAELEAIANGLWFADAQGYFAASDGLIMIQSDNTEALGCIRKIRPSSVERKHSDGAHIPHRKKDLLPRQGFAVESILTIADRHKLTISLRHVKGHRVGGGRNWVNRLCDRLANEGRKAPIRNQSSPELLQALEGAEWSEA